MRANCTRGFPLTPPTRPPTPRLILLDRDGVINEDSPHYIKSVPEWQPIPGALEAIARLSRHLPVAVCTNQAGIARGKLSQKDLCAIHAEMHRRVAALGGEIRIVRYCPHHPDAKCSCRKPNPAMLRQCCDWIGIAPADTWFVGDSRKDLEAARNAGCHPVLVRTGNGRQTEALVDPAGCWVFEDLQSALEATGKC